MLFVLLQPLASHFHEKLQVPSLNISPHTAMSYFSNYGEGNGTPLQYSCLENPMDGGPWQAAVHGVAKNWTWLSNFTFTFHFYALEKEMATHSSVLAWRIPGMGEPVGLPSMGLHRAGHDWSDLAVAVAGLPLIGKCYWTFSFQLMSPFHHISQSIAV